MSRTSAPPTARSNIARALAQDRLGIPSVVYLVLSGVAPLTVAAGVVTTVFGVLAVGGIAWALVLRSTQPAVYAAIGFGPQAATISSNASTAHRPASALAEQGIAEENSYRLVYSEVIDPPTLDDSIRLTAHQLQAWVPKDHEVRLTVVDEQLYPARIDGRSAAAVVDWRSDYDSLDYSVTDVPATVRHGVHALMRTLRPRFGALDFVVTPGGDWCLPRIEQQRPVGLDRRTHRTADRGRHRRCPDKGVTVPETSAALRAQLVQHLERTGALRSKPWIDAFTVVPREVFAPRYFTFRDTGGHIAVARSDPDWLGPIYADRVLPTQLDSDPSRWEHARQTGEPVEGIPTCSLTMPSLTAVLLEALDVQDGDRVLEIGTGTGYNAALLAQRLGDPHITTIDIDPALTAEASKHLSKAGYNPTVLTGDGTEGAPAYAPFDRIVATVSVLRIPPAWLQQTRPGGTIVANLHCSPTGGFLVALTVDDDGGAAGHLLDDDGTYMPVRSHPQPNTDELLRAASRDEDGQTRHTDITFDPHNPQPWHVIADATLPQTTVVEFTSGDEPLTWLVHPDGSWAVRYANSNNVEQHRRGGVLPARGPPAPVLCAARLPPP